MDKYNLTVLAEAKQEYTRQLVNILYPEMYIGLKSIYDAAKIVCEKKGDKNILKKFQELLSHIPKWNTDRINDEYRRIVRASDCEWIEDLITAVFVSHTKVLTSIKVKNKNKKTLELNVPNGPYFLHKCYVEAARNFWKKPFLFYHNFQNIELQRNLSDAEALIKESIIETIRKQLPVKHILQEYLGGDFRDEDAEEDITSNVSTNTKENLRKLVKAEIEQTLLNKKDDDTHSVVKIENDTSESTDNKLYDTNDKTSEILKDTIEKFSNKNENDEFATKSNIQSIHDLDNDIKSLVGGDINKDKDSELVLNEIKQSIRESNVDLTNLEFNVDTKSEALDVDIKKIEINTKKKYTNIGGSSNTPEINNKLRDEVKSFIEDNKSIQSTKIDIKSTISSKTPIQTSIPNNTNLNNNKADEFSFFADAAPF